MHKDAKIGITTTVFVCLIGLIAWNSRQTVDKNQAAFVKNKREVYQFPIGTSPLTIEKWSKKRGLDFRITTRKNSGFEKNSIIIFSGVPFKAINSYGTAFSKKDGIHGYQFLFDSEGSLIKAWAEDYSPGVKSNYSP